MANAKPRFGDNNMRVADRGQVLRRDLRVHPHALPVVFRPGLLRPHSAGRACTFVR